MTGESCSVLVFQPAFKKSSRSGLYLQSPLHMSGGPHFLRAWLGSPPFGRSCSVEGVSRSSQRKVGTPSLSNLSQDVILFSGMNGQFQKKKISWYELDPFSPSLYGSETGRQDRRSEEVSSLKPSHNDFP